MAIIGMSAGRRPVMAMRWFEKLNSFLPRWLPFGFPARHRKAVKHLDEVVYGVIARKRAQATVGTDLLSLFLSARDEDGTQMTDRQLRGEVLTMLLAGHETTANTLSWSWYLLSQDARVSELFHREIDALVHPLGPGDMARLPYTNAIVRESLRLYPPAWAMGRELVAEFELAGHVLKPGAELFMSPWLVHRDPRWFPDPLAFRPERWLDGSTQDLPTYAYFPFGGGQRMCIGKGFALMEAALCLASIAKRFRLIHVGAPPKLRASLTLRPEKGLPMRVQQRVS